MGYVGFQCNGKRYAEIFISFIIQVVYHLLLSKKLEGNEQLMKSFNQGLKRLKKSGKVEQYFAESQRGEYRKKR